MIFAAVGQQVALPGMQPSPADRTHQGTGMWGEVWTMIALQRGGYAVRRTIRGIEPGDVRAFDLENGQSWYLEVKTARADRRGIWQFCLLKEVDGRIRTDHRRANCVVLLAVHASGRVTTFVIPARELTTIRKISIRNPDRYQGRFAAYRQAERVLKL